MKNSSVVSIILFVLLCIGLVFFLVNTSGVAKNIPTTTQSTSTSSNNESTSTSDSSSTSLSVSTTTTNKDTGINTNPPIACTMEAKLCSDGSYVGRTGPYCEFSPCPSNIPPTSSTSGIVGNVLLGPTCPVERNPPDPQCADRPYQTILTVTNSDGTKIITQFSSDSFGNFKINLSAGEYLIKSSNAQSMLPRCSSNGVIVVQAGFYTNATVSCDTGIR